ncbi:ATP-dependent RNA helicase drs1 [Penicillium riverlandense]|uniref:ATP-dependent RNA helicase drs1 n=1 Tax=Penicillium riverlandense TaxID=1903569 RepID=UPI0025481534|nr:ATP-dependent RNA helicase drs1 [Penicillium riverlandense]KAJ5819257.1 ATP-dependent RNA helicase drs1 [Penicillium riverlandense]
MQITLSFSQTVLEELDLGPEDLVQVCLPAVSNCGVLCRFPVNQKIPTYPSVLSRKMHDIECKPSLLRLARGPLPEPSSTPGSTAQEKANTVEKPFKKERTSNTNTMVGHQPKTSGGHPLRSYRLIINQPQELEAPNTSGPPKTGGGHPPGRFRLITSQLQELEAPKTSGSHPPGKTLLGTGQLQELQSDTVKKDRQPNPGMPAIETSIPWKMVPKVLAHDLSRDKNQRGTDDRSRMPAWSGQHSGAHDPNPFVNDGRLDGKNPPGSALYVPPVNAPSGGNMNPFAGPSAKNPTQITPSDLTGVPLGDTVGTGGTGPLGPQDCPWDNYDEKFAGPKVEIRRNNIIITDQTRRTDSAGNDICTEKGLLTALRTGTMTEEEVKAHIKQLQQPIIDEARLNVFHRMQEPCGACTEALPTVRTGPGTDLNEELYHMLGAARYAQGVEAPEAWAENPPDIIPGFGYEEVDPDVNWKKVRQGTSLFYAQWDRYDDSARAWPQLVEGKVLLTAGRPEGIMYDPLPFPHLPQTLGFSEITPENRGPWNANWNFCPSYNGDREAFFCVFWRWLEMIPEECQVVDIYHTGFFDGTAGSDGGFSLFMQNIKHLPTPRDMQDEQTRLHWHETATGFIHNYNYHLAKEKKAEAARKKERQEQEKERALARIIVQVPKAVEANVFLRPAEFSDIPGLQYLFNWYMENSPISPEKRPLAEDDIRNLIDDARTTMLPFIVAVQRHSYNNPRKKHRASTEKILGYAFVKHFNESNSANSNIGEMRVFVDHNHKKQHIGRALVDRILMTVDVTHHGSGGHDFQPGEHYRSLHATRPFTTMICAIAYPEDKEANYTWTKQWLVREFDFQVQGVMKRARLKLGDLLDVCYVVRHMLAVYTAMAPNPAIRRSSVKEDDFVLTLSDDEETPRFDDEEEDGIKAPSSKETKKRKRETTEAPTKAKNKNKKNKTQSAAKAVAETSDVADESDDDAGDEDEALDPDFEFDVGGATSGVTEGFDGWGIGESDKQQQQQKNGDKKAVDIDDIISRRRERKERLSKRKDKKIEEVEEVGSGDEDDVVSDAEEVDFEDDELMADDAFGMGVDGEEESEAEGPEVGSGPESDDEEEDDDEDDDAASDNDSVATPVGHPDDIGSDRGSDDESEVDVEEQEKRKAFFAPEEKTDAQTAAAAAKSTFQDFNLSRPILRGLASIGFTDPTPIQRKAVPVALLGKDIVGSAVTGSGKTAAFMVPILERLLFRPRKVATSRVAILMPTRELAVQCYNVAVKLATFTDITFCQLVGGFSLREQENILKKRPDVIIATPGRFIDHMRNSPSFTVDTLEILVLDEADRMLEDGFADELNEILTTIPKSRQTMLFSATMTDTVDKLIRVGLNRPVRLMVDAKKQTAVTLVQEFVRLRPGREDKRLGYLLHLCKEIYTGRVIIFFRQKKESHRVRIIFGLLGLKAAELHGSLSQEQRIKSVENFRDGKVAFLLATDLASRGLDIKGVETVINYEAPQSHEIYVHRVGRTARAGRSGRACTIAAEPDRKVVKAAVKSGKAQGAKIVSRVVDLAVADDWAQKAEDLADEVEEILQEEKTEKQLSQAEMQVTKGENLIKHGNEIMARPKRTWFETERDKRASRKLGAEALNGPNARSKKDKGKLSNKDKKRLDDMKERHEGTMGWKKGKNERESKEVKGKKKGKKGGKK